MSEGFVPLSTAPASSQYVPRSAVVAGLCQAGQATVSPARSPPRLSPYREELGDSHCILFVVRLLGAYSHRLGEEREAYRQWLRTAPHKWSGANVEGVAWRSARVFKHISCVDQAHTIHFYRKPRFRRQEKAERGRERRCFRGPGLSF